MAESLEQHYRRLLGLEEPWVVEAVNLELAAQRVEIRLRAQVYHGVEMSGMWKMVCALRPRAGTAMEAFGHDAV